MPPSPSTLKGLSACPASPEQPSDRKTSLSHFPVALHPRPRVRTCSLTPPQEKPRRSDYQSRCHRPLSEPSPHRRTLPSQHRHHRGRRGPMVSTPLHAAPSPGHTPRSKRLRLHDNPSILLVFPVQHGRSEEGRAGAGMCGGDGECAVRGCGRREEKTKSLRAWLPEQSQSRSAGADEVVETKD